ncbi:MAG: hypothetical protein HZB98_13035 [Bacteroidia bacterium]|nr:hypothetical protein [Bacteroidia bacterium]
MKKLLLTTSFILVVSALQSQEIFTDKRDGNVYRTITLNGITWMAENLRFKTKNGAVYYDNNPDNARDYGMLYDWKAAKTVCPSGWHLPSGNEFRTLSDHFQLQESWRKESKDTVSFTIQLGGFQDHEGTFSELDESGYYWTATEYDNKSAEYFSYLIIDNMIVTDISRKEDVDDISGTDKNDKYSVRCIKN